LFTYYDILRVPEDADDKEIKAAYRQAALAYHPDHIPKGVSKRMRDDATQTWLEIQEAFAVLSDPEKRKEYDTRLEEMRQSEEAEKQFEPTTPPPAPPKPKPTPAPTPQQTTPQPTPQPQPIPPTKSRSAWVWFCFQLGRHWHEVCFIVAVVLFVANGFRDSETWTVMSVGIIFTSIMAAFFIVVASGPTWTWKDKGRFIVNAFCLIALVVTGITAGSINPLPPKAAVAASDKPPAATTAPVKNTTPNTSATPFAGTLKKYGFEAMPPGCVNAPLNELDSCLAKVKADFEKKHLKAQKATQASAVDNSWLTQLPGEYLFPCFETDRSRCSSTVNYIKYQPQEKVLMETEQFQDYYLDTDKKYKPSSGRWYVSCPLHQNKNGHWTGKCTYSLVWKEPGKPVETACDFTTSEEITEITREGLVSGISGRIDWTPRNNALDPGCPQDSGTKKEFQLVPKQ
jgi:hypothetical protein